MTVQYLQGLNIFVIKELTIATLFAWMLVWEMEHSEEGFFAFPAGSQVAF